MIYQSKVSCIFLNHFCLLPGLNSNQFDLAKYRVELAGYMLVAIKPGSQYV